MLKPIFLLVAALAIAGAAPTASRSSQKKPVSRQTVSALQGTVLSVTEKMLVVDFYGATTAHGRQVDISNATYETADGKVVTPYPIHNGDKIIVIAASIEPSSYRPRPKPKGMSPAFIQLLPIKAMVVELIPSFRHGVPPGSDKG